MIAPCSRKFFLRSLPIGIVLIGLTACTALALPTKRDREATRLGTPSRSIYWGAYINGADTYAPLYGGSWGDAPWNARTWNTFASHAGKEPSIVHWGAGAPWDHDFNYWLGTFKLVKARGDLNLVTLQSRSVKLSDIAQGAYDSYFRAWAQQARAWGHPFFLRWDWEMNGSWFSWGTTASNQNTAADYVAAWRHIHDIFTQAGATNVTWVWCVNVDPAGRFTPFGQLYPGDAYVDWTALDGYNQTGNQSFKWLFSRSYHKLVRLAPDKPIMIVETSSIEGGILRKPAWITNALTKQLPRGFPQIKAFLWLNWRISDQSWEIESSTGSQFAFRNGIRSSYYRAGGRFGHLPRLTKINPLP
jgi:Glycosyl hydrolase family 26